MVDWYCLYCSLVHSSVRMFYNSKMGVPHSWSNIFSCRNNSRFWDLARYLVDKISLVGRIAATNILSGHKSM
jgi:hypothetical protein